MILLDNYLQIFSLAYLFVHGGSKIFDSCLTKIIFWRAMACLYDPLAALTPAQVPIPPKHSLWLTPLLMWVHCFARKNYPQDNLLFAQCTSGVLRSSASARCDG